MTILVTTLAIIAHLGERIRICYMNEGLRPPVHLHRMGQLVVANDGYAPPGYEDTVWWPLASAST